MLSPTMPLSAGRRFQIDTKRTTMNPQSNRRGSNEELVVAEIGQQVYEFALIVEPLKIQGGT